MRKLVLFILISSSLFSAPRESNSEQLHELLSSTTKRIAYLGVGLAFGTLSGVARVGWEISQFLPNMGFRTNEWQLLRRLSSSIAIHAFKGAVGRNSPSSLPFRKAWEDNQQLLKQIPTTTLDEKKLLHFLQERWLAKVASFSTLMMDWVYPCFGIKYLVHPGANHSYARLLTDQFCSAYANRVQEWKKELPHPLDFPLILTRPNLLNKYLPSCMELFEGQDISSMFQSIGSEPLLLDVSHLFTKKRWLKEWEEFQNHFQKACQEKEIDPNLIVCFQKMNQEAIGGIRLLSCKGQSVEKGEVQYRKLLDWMSGCGLGANRVELDRWPDDSTIQESAPTKPISHETINSLEHATSSLQKSIATIKCNPQWLNAPVHKRVILQGILNILEGLLEEKQPIASPAKLQVIELVSQKISRAFDELGTLGPDISFPRLSILLEPICADVSSLIEIFKPCTQKHFAQIYHDLLVSIPGSPKTLQSLTSCGIHTSGMTSLASIVKSVEKMVGRRPNVLYGENTYFECVNSLKKMARASCTTEALDEEWDKADLLVAQFNPVLHLRGDIEYTQEQVARNLRRCLEVRNKKPFTLALDCTIDFLRSELLSNLLQEFSQEIENGSLNVIGFRSGNKFDLFGMDNYCGAPFFMINDQDPKWICFQSLFEDACLQADPLSVNWFSLAYHHAAPFLDLYRRQIFDNTRTLLNKAPEGLLTNQAGYRISRADEAAKLAFLDIKIFGPLHAFRGAAMVVLSFYIQCMEEGRLLFNRPSLGFYHPNCTMRFGDDHSTIRLTLGLDPAEVDLFAHCLNTIDRL